MGDNKEGSSTAAHSARASQTNNHHEQTSRVMELLYKIFRRVRVFSKTAAVTPGMEVPLSNLDVRNLSLKHVEDVAIPRAEIVSIPVDVSLNEVVKVFRDSGLTRLPVFKDTLDNPVGLLHLKDLSLKYGFNGASKEFNIKAMVRPVLFVPPSMTIGVLLSKMQAERKHLA
ncbi:MAG: CBS domain-containing protein, partial [Rhodobacteraceae bacterium]|nr:CBS domain-containing protein [Paracoccaceae bacterium]